MTQLWISDRCLEPTPGQIHPSLDQMWAYSLRPDLWPPGWVASTKRAFYAHRTGSPVTAFWLATLAVNDGHDRPGHAEAAILSGGVRVVAPGTSRDWAIWTREGPHP